MPFCNWADNYDLWFCVRLPRPLFLLGGKIKTIIPTLQSNWKRVGVTHSMRGCDIGECVFRRYFLGSYLPGRTTFPDSRTREGFRGGQGNSGRLIINYSWGGVTESKARTGFAELFHSIRRSRSNSINPPIALFIHEVRRRGFPLISSPLLPICVSYSDCTHAKRVDW